MARNKGDRDDRKQGVAKRIAFNLLRNDKEKYPKKSANTKRIHAFGDKNYRDYIMKINFNMN